MYFRLTLDVEKDKKSLVELVQSLGDYLTKDESPVRVKGGVMEPDMRFFVR
jgi:hypothetical protein